MKAANATPDMAGRRIRVTAVAPSEAEKLGYINDTKRLLGQTGIIQRVNAMTMLAGGSQVIVAWDEKAPGSLMLCGDDKFEIIA